MGKQALNWRKIGVLVFILFVGIATVVWIASGQSITGTVISAIFVAIGLVLSFLQVFPAPKDQYNPAAKPLPPQFPPVADSHELQKHSENLPPVPESSQASSPANASSVATRSREYWGDAPLVRQFYGRVQEARALEEALLEDRYRLIVLLAIGGMGKTTLAVELARRVKDHFSLLYWSSLHNAPPLEQLLTGYLNFFGRGLSEEATLDERISSVLATFREERVLLILDNFESLMLDGQRAGQYRPEHEDYGRFLLRVGESEHQSSILITSREKPRELARLKTKIQSISLSGISVPEAKKLLKESELSGSDEVWSRYVQLYSGNPLALLLSAEMIEELFAGEIARFLEGGEAVFGDIQDILAQQFARLSPLEQELMYWLAIEREPVTFAELQAVISHPVQKTVLLDALSSLRRRSLLELHEDSTYTLQSVIIEYVTRDFVERVGRELLANAPALLATHALLKAQARDYVRASQIEQIIEPLLTQVLRVWGEQHLRSECEQILVQIRSSPALLQSYAAGNMLNLLVQAHCNLRQSNFSGLLLRQPYLQDATLVDVNFVQAEFRNAVFADTFGGVLSLAHSGTLLAVGTASGELRVWRTLEEGDFVSYSGHVDAVWSLAFSPDARLLASCSQDQTIRLWDVASGECLHVLQESGPRIWSLAFSPDGAQLASGGDDSQLRLWDVRTGRLTRVLHSFASHILTLAFRPDGKTLACAQENAHLSLVDVTSGKVYATLRDAGKMIRSIAFHPSGQLLAGGGDDQQIYLWNLDTERCETILTGHSAAIRTLAFRPDGKLLASGGDDRMVRLWEPEQGQQSGVLQGHTDRVWSLAWGASGETLATGSEDQTVRIWNVAHQKALRVLRGYSSWIWALACSSDGRLLAYSDQNASIRDDAGNSVVLRGHSSRVRSLAFHPTGELIVTGSEDQTLRLWEVRNGHCLRIFQGHTQWVRAVACSPDGALLASAGDDLTVRLWETETGICTHVLQGHTRKLRCVAFHPSGKLLASAGVDQVIRLWDVATGHLVRELTGHTDRVRALIFLQAGAMLASAGEDRVIYLWETQTGNSLAQLHGHTQGIRALTAASSGLLASAGDDRSICLWNVGSRERVRTLTGHQGRIRALAFRASEEHLLSGSDDGTLRIWNSRSGELIDMLRSERPYERMCIRDVKGLSAAQRASLFALGATLENNQ